MTTPGYSNAHYLVRRTRGPAKNYLCIGCSSTARDWALRRELVDAGVPYSMDPTDYNPLCRSCHKRHDMTEELLAKTRTAKRRTRGENLKVGYSNAHTLLFLKRGPAKEQICIECKDPAQQWALRRELHDLGISYSMDPADYYPMCRSCHKRHDMTPEQIKKLTDQKGALGHDGRKASAAVTRRRESDPEFDARIEDAQRRGGFTLAERRKVDDELDKRLRSAVRGNAVALNKIKRRCLDCSLIRAPGPMGLHLKASKHRGYETL